MALEIKINKTPQSRIGLLDEKNINFGRLYSDHMLVAHYENGEWQTPEILPYGDITMSPATTFIHYGQSMFVGIKA